MPALRTKLAFSLAVIALLRSASPAASEPPEKVWCLRYAEAPNAPLSGLLAGAPRDAMLDLPFAMCVARSPSQAVVLDSGFVNRKLGEPFGARDWGRICYSSDAVYTYRNIDEDIPLGLAINAEQAVESFEKIRRILRGGKLIPGHEPRIFARPEDFDFRRVSAHAIAVVE